MTFEETGLPWVMPSPTCRPWKRPSSTQAVPDRGTNLSEGRGTTRPFELSGAPWIDPARLVRELDRGPPGVVFRPTWFRPTFQKFADQDCGWRGTDSRHGPDRVPARPNGLALLAAMRDHSGTRFAWRTEEYEFVRDRPAIDLLFGKRP